MLPDLLATATLFSLAIYHLMIYLGRRKEAEEVYNLYFSLFVFAAALFIIAPYFQPQYFLYAIKPTWLTVMNIEAFMVLSLFYGGIKFLNLLLKISQKYKRYFYFTFSTISLNFFLTFTSNIFGPQFYYEHILSIILFIVLVNTILIYVVYGLWVYRQKLYKKRFYQILYLGFVSLTANILIYRSIELLTIPTILVLNHYVSAIILYIFAYAISVKFNAEYFELKELKISLEKKVEERTEALEKSNQLLGTQNLEIENQKQKIIIINQELSLRADELFNLNLAKTRFVTGISHEFRTPLTLIIGPLERLLSEAANSHLKKDFELILRQANRLLELVNQLLELSKLQKGMQTLSVVQGNFNLFIQTIFSAYHPFAKELSIQLSLIEEDSNILIWFDRDKLEKIITNLLTNALKFSKSGGKVEVVLSCTDDKQYVEIIVRDNGIGMAPDQLEFIFDPFYRVESNTAPRFEGTGIGLSLVKELVELHHGIIKVKSVMHKGSEFIVRLPAYKETYGVDEVARDEQTKEVNLISDHDSNAMLRSMVNEQKIILLVEDNLDMRTYIKSCLSTEYVIVEASNGQEGLDTASELVPDLIITDLMMPVLDGLEMTRLLKQDEHICHIPVIMLTAKASTESKLEGLSTQADDYVTKPFNSAELGLRIQNLLTSRERLKEKFSKCITVNPSELVTTSVDEKFLQKALGIVESKMGETEFSAEQFCDDISMSRAHVHRKLKALTGQSATHFIRSIRLKRAAQLLKDRSASVSEIAYQTGFNNLSYFTRSFKEQYGELPSTFLKMSDTE